jgi:cytosine/adenosine deaminase-related metal-dependent hydrolase
MFGRILIKNISYLVTMDTEKRILKDSHLVIKENRIDTIGENPLPNYEFLKDIKSNDIKKNPIIKNDRLCNPRNNFESENPKGHTKPYNDYKFDEIIDAKDMVILPGFINTHHHLYQNLTRCFPASQNASLFNWLITLYPIWAKFEPYDFYISALVGIIELILSGCTTTVDHLYIFPGGQDAVIENELRAVQESGIRFCLARGSMSLSEEEGGLPPRQLVQSEDTILKQCQKLAEKYGEKRSGKYNKNDSSTIQLILAPTSPFSVTKSLMKNIMDLAIEFNLRCNTHLAENKQENEFCLKTYNQRPFDYMKEIGWIRDNVFFTHTVYLNEKEIFELSKNGVGVSHCPSSNMRLASGIAPIKEMLDEKVNVSIGVDGSSSNDSSNILAEMRMAMLCQRSRGSDKIIFPEQTLEISTLGGAKVLGRDAEIGSIEEGKIADIIGFNLEKIEYAGAYENPIGALLLCQPTNVDLSIINGKLIVKNGILLNIDLQEVLRNHKERTNLLLSRI